MKKPFENKCIVCGSEELDYGETSIDIDGKTIVKNVTCNICNTRFKIYFPNSWVYETKDAKRIYI